MKNIPEKIWLQVGDPDIMLGPHDDFNQCNEVTWCKDKIFEYDIPYVLEQPPQPAPGRFVPEEEIQKLREWNGTGLIDDILDAVDDFLQAIEKTEEK